MPCGVVFELKTFELGTARGIIKFIPCNVYYQTEGSATIDKHQVDKILDKSKILNSPIEKLVLKDFMKTANANA
jgi:hypothetical protein